MKSKGLICGGLLLLAAALCLTLWNVRQDRAAAQSAQSALLEMKSRLPEPVAEPVPGAPDEDGGVPAESAEPEPPAYVTDPSMPMPVQEIDGEGYIGILQIPDLALELPIIGEWSYPRLRTAPCRYVGSAYTHDLIIAAHNYASHFGGLASLAQGSEVIFTDMDGNRFIYAVSETEQLPGTAIEEMKSGDWDLTLFTCTIGGAARVTVRCVLTAEEPA